MDADSLLLELFKQEAGLWSDRVKPNQEARLGVSLHPLARLLAFPDKAAERRMRRQMRALRRSGGVIPPVTFVDSALLDGRSRWLVAGALGLDPARDLPKQELNECEALRHFLQHNVSPRPGGSWRAAVGWAAARMEADDLADLRRMIAPSESDKNFNVVRELGNYCAVSERMMYYALSAAVTDPRQFLGVFMQRRRTFLGPKAPQPHPRVLRSLGRRLRDRILSRFAATQKGAFRPDLILCRAAASPDDLMFCVMENPKQYFDFLRSELTGLVHKTSQAFLCLILPPALLVNKCFVEFRDWLEEHGYVTRATVSACTGPGIEQCQVVPAWEFVWILSKPAEQPIQGKLVNALAPPPDTPPRRGWQPILSQLLKALCPPKGCLYFCGGEDQFALNLLRALDPMDLSVVIPDVLESKFADLRLDVAS